MTNLTPTTAIISLALAALTLLMLGAFTRNTKLVGACTFAGLLALAAYVFTNPAIGQAFVTAHGPLLGFSPFTNLAMVIVLALASLASLLVGDFYTQHKSLSSGTSAKDGAYRPELYVLLTLSLAGMGVLMAATDMLTVYLGLELMSFPLYILAATLRENAKSSEAALKYFVLGGLVSGLFLFGVSLVYAATGTTQFAAIATAVGTGATPLMMVGLALTLLAFLFKLSVVPFHMWTPDVYEGAPTPVTALMAALPKVAAVVALIRLLHGPMDGLAALWQPALAVLAMASMVLGSFVAIMQTNLKRLLAFSTIAHVGFVLVGVVAGTAQGHSGVLFYMAVYGLTTLGLFASIMALKAETVTSLQGLSRTHPLMALTLLILLFSLAGVPPFAGFMAKFAVFGAAIQAGYTWLALAGVLASVIALFYSLWLVKVIYFDASTSSETPTSTPPCLLAVIVAAVVGTVLLGVFPHLLATLTLPAGTALF
ncbi:MAG: NADH-quinone oxidoreductase subunit N [Alphaproteobacteria bacterium]